jgi:phage/plasmid-like protein (TIGR03299 family)
MAHNLTYANGKYEFAYAGESPWHGLGQRLPNVATKEDIMRAAGLEWTVLGEPLYLAGGAAVPGFVANVRSDTREVLGVVSTDYRIVQNGDAFGFVEKLANTAGAKYHTAGSIRRGRQVFATAKLPQSMTVVPTDVVEQYLLLVNAHDGSLGFHLRWTSIRVVCNNTLTAALHGKGDYQYTVRHVGDLDAQLAEAAKALGMATRYFEIAGQAYRALAAAELTAGTFETFLDGFLPVPLPSVDAPSSEAAVAERDRIILARDRVRVLYESGSGTEIPGVRGTAWGAFNAATEWIDRVRTAKKDGDLRQNASEAAVLGVGQDLRDRAMASALAVISPLGKATN